MPAPTSDEALAVAFAAHERWAFSEAYQRYASLLYSTAYNVLANSEEAQDCVHDTIAKLWRSTQPYSPTRGNLRSFLVVCTRNDAISRRRRDARRARLDQRLAGLAPEPEELKVADPIESDRVRRALRGLPNEQRLALEMAYYEGKTHTEIASELQQPLGTIKGRINLGLHKLARALEPASAAGDRL
jgi:RNA polymerase sigma-70 factor (ECF subfamily)